MKENSEYKILIVDDEEDILEFLSYNLKKEGFTVYTEENGINAIKTASKIIPDLIIIDVMMPGIDGIETCEELRQNPKLKDSSITFLTARSEDYSEIAGFKAGADDYITKPIRPKVLIARIHALLKRKALQTEDTNHNIIQFDNIIIDIEKHLVIIDNDELSLPNKEFKLLILLCSKPERVFTREEIYNTVWGSDVVVGDRTIDVHIRKLREKLGSKYIETIKGIGYKFIQSK
jgi:two-component system, OmpR family, alkaline phosphatase synthesis response regulator PhoP